MSDKVSSIWLELELPRQRKILVCNFYREWQYLGQEDDSSSTIESQNICFIEFLDQWERAIITGREIHVLGYFNLNFLDWTSLAPSSQTEKLRPLINQLFDRIIPQGFSQLVTVATRYWPGQEPSGLDHYLSLIHISEPTRLLSIS